METKKRTHRYLEWISPDEMHSATVQWLSELKFVRDEQLFLNDLVKSYTLQLIDKKTFEESKALVSNILASEKEVIVLMKRVQIHENQLEIMIDEIDQPKMEKAYLETHLELIKTMENYMQEYRDLKTKLFAMISKILKKEKQKRLLN